MDYLAPTSVKETIAILKKAKRGARLIAGATDVLPRVAVGKAPAPRQLVSIAALPDLDRIAAGARGILRIGARVTLNEVARSNRLARRSTALAEAAACVGSEQIRNTATLVGNLCSASSAADTIPPLLCADALAEVVGPKGRRRVPIDDLLAGPRKLALKPDEIVLAIRIPRPKGRIGSAYRRHGPRAAMDCAVVIAAAEIVAAKDKIIEARLALGAVHPIPVRCPDAERVLTGQAISDELLAEAAAAAAQAVRPVSDIRASADHRKAVVRRIVPEILLQAFIRAGGKR
ncbi:MAG: FAD binding domain-containing protein [Phycisphaerae bacterium]|nr:FAD binding domain-containing protein [Phycisphaerae bacterium]